LAKTNEGWVKTKPTGKVQKRVSWGNGKKNKEASSFRKSLLKARRRKEKFQEKSADTQQKEREETRFPIMVREKSKTTTCENAKRREDVWDQG